MLAAAARGSQSKGKLIHDYILYIGAGWLHSVRDLCKQIQVTGVNAGMVSVRWGEGWEEEPQAQQTERQTDRQTDWTRKKGRVRKFKVQQHWLSRSDLCYFSLLSPYSRNRNRTKPRHVCPTIQTVYCDLCWWALVRSALINIQVLKSVKYNSIWASLWAEH